MKMRKILPLAFAMTLAVTMTSCGKTNAEPEKETQKSSTKDDYSTISTKELQDIMGEQNTVVLDARTQDSYSGWALNGDERGGHIKGAKNFSSQWLTVDYDDTNNLEEMTRNEVLEDSLKNKGVTKESKVVVYDTNGEDAKKVADYLSKEGITDISLYDANEWIKDTSLEMVSYPNYSLYVPASIVNDIANGDIPEGFTSAKEIKIFDVRWGDEEESGYLDGHIPTAVHINTDSIEPPRESASGTTEWMLADDDVLLNVMLENGITSDTCVIFTSSEPMAACRLAVISKYLGVKDVRVLSGGLSSWSAQGYTLDKTSVAATPVEEFGIDKIPANPDWIETIEEVKEDLNKSDFTLADNRTWEEHIGEVTGYDYHKIAGRINGSVYAYAGKNSSYSLYYYRNIDKTMRDSDEILNMWEEAGLDTNNRLAFMCGSGWRAAEVLWDAKVMGLDNTTLYSDGWIGWSNLGYDYVVGEP